MRTGRYHVCLLPGLAIDDPVSERVYKAEPFGTAWLDYDHHAIVAKSLPQSLYNKLSLDGCGHFLQDVAHYDQVKLTALTGRDHGKRVNPEDGLLELVF